MAQQDIMQECENLIKEKIPPGEFLYENLIKRYKNEFYMKKLTIFQQKQDTKEQYDGIEEEIFDVEQWKKLLLKNFSEEGKHFLNKLKEALPSNYQTAFLVNCFCRPNVLRVIQNLRRIKQETLGVPLEKIIEEDIKFEAVYQFQLLYTEIPDNFIERNQETNQFQITQQFQVLLNEEEVKNLKNLHNLTLRDQINQTINQFTQLILEDPSELAKQKYLYDIQIERSINLYLNIKKEEEKDVVQDHSISPESQFEIVLGSLIKNCLGIDQKEIKIIQTEGFQYMKQFKPFPCSVDILEDNKAENGYMKLMNYLQSLSLEVEQKQQNINKLFLEIQQNIKFLDYTEIHLLLLLKEQIQNVNKRFNENTIKETNDRYKCLIQIFENISDKAQWKIYYRFFGKQADILKTQLSQCQAQNTQNNFLKQKHLQEQIEAFYKIRLAASTSSQQKEQEEEKFPQFEKQPSYTQIQPSYPSLIKVPSKGAKLDNQQTLNIILNNKDKIIQKINAYQDQLKNKKKLLLALYQGIQNQKIFTLTKQNQFDQLLESIFNGNGKLYQEIEGENLNIKTKTDILNEFYEFLLLKYESQQINDKLFDYFQTNLCYHIYKIPISILDSQNEFANEKLFNPFIMTPLDQKPTEENFSAIDERLKNFLKDPKQFFEFLTRNPEFKGQCSQLVQIWSQINNKIKLINELKLYNFNNDRVNFKTCVQLIDHIYDKGFQDLELQLKQFQGYGEEIIATFLFENNNIIKDYYDNQQINNNITSLDISKYILQQLYIRIIQKQQQQQQIDQFQNNELFQFSNSIAEQTLLNGFAKPYELYQLISHNNKIEERQFQMLIKIEKEVKKFEEKEKKHFYQKFFQYLYQKEQNYFSSKVNFSFLKNDNNQEFKSIQAKYNDDQIQLYHILLLLSTKFQKKEQILCTDCFRISYNLINKGINYLMKSKQQDNLMKKLQKNLIYKSPLGLFQSIEHLLLTNQKNINNKEDLLKQQLIIYLRDTFFLKSNDQNQRLDYIYNYLYQERDQNNHSIQQIQQQLKANFTQEKSKMLFEILLNIEIQQIVEKPYFTENNQNITPSIISGGDPQPIIQPIINFQRKKITVQELETFQIFDENQHFNSLREIIKQILDDQQNFVKLINYLLFVSRREIEIDYIFEIFKTLQTQNSKSQHLLGQRYCMNELFTNNDQGCKQKLMLSLSIRNPLPLLDYQNKSEQCLIYEDIFWLDFKQFPFLCVINAGEQNNNSFFVNLLFGTKFEEVDQSLQNHQLYNGTADFQTNFYFKKENMRGFHVINTYGKLSKKNLQFVCNFSDHIIITVDFNELQENKNKVQHSILIILELNYQSQRIIILFITNTPDQIINDQQNSNNKQNILQIINFDKNKEFFDKFSFVEFLFKQQNNLQKKVTEDKLKEIRKNIHQQIKQNYKSSQNDRNQLILTKLKEEGRENISNSLSSIEEQIQLLQKSIDISKDKDQPKIEQILKFYFVFYQYEKAKMEAQALQQNENQHENIDKKKQLYFKILPSEKTSIYIQQFLEFFIKQDQTFSCAYWHLAASLQNNSQKQKSSNQESLQPTIEMLWREVAQTYAIKQTDSSNKQQFDASKEQHWILDSYKKVIENGYPFEMIDGEIFHFHYNLLLDIFKQLSQKDEKFLVISIIGPQNSGKSTLLNKIFGKDFAVLDGRCTKGINGIMINSKSPNFSKIILIDSEGLQSIEKMNQEHDNRITLFCLSISNAVILNIDDQLDRAIIDLLQLCSNTLSQLQYNKLANPDIYICYNKLKNINRDNNQAVSILKQQLEKQNIKNINIKEHFNVPQAFEDQQLLHKEEGESWQFQKFSKQYMNSVNNIAQKIIENFQFQQTKFKNLLEFIEFCFDISSAINNSNNLSNLRDHRENRVILLKNIKLLFLIKQLKTQIQSEINKIIEKQKEKVEEIVKHFQDDKKKQEEQILKIISESQLNLQDQLQDKISEEEQHILQEKYQNLKQQIYKIQNQMNIAIEEKKNRQFYQQEYQNQIKNIQVDLMFQAKIDKDKKISQEQATQNARNIIEKYQEESKNAIKDQIKNTKQQFIEIQILKPINNVLQQQKIEIKLEDLIEGNNQKQLINLVQPFGNKDQQDNWRKAVVNMKLFIEKKPILLNKEKIFSNQQKFHRLINHIFSYEIQFESNQDQKKQEYEIQQQKENFNNSILKSYGIKFDETYLQNQVKPKVRFFPDIDYVKIQDFEKFNSIEFDAYDKQHCIEKIKFPQAKPKLLEDKFYYEFLDKIQKTINDGKLIQQMCHDFIQNFVDLKIYSEFLDQNILKGENMELDNNRLQQIIEKQKDFETQVNEELEDFGYQISKEIQIYGYNKLCQRLSQISLQQGENKAIHFIEKELADKANEIKNIYLNIVNNKSQEEISVKCIVNLLNKAFITSFNQKLSKIQVENFENWKKLQQITRNKIMIECDGLLGLDMSSIEWQQRYISQPLEIVKEELSKKIQIFIESEEQKFKELKLKCKENIQNLLLSITAIKTILSKLSVKSSVDHFKIKKEGHITQDNCFLYYFLSFFQPKFYQFDTVVELPNSSDFSFKEENKITDDIQEIFSSIVQTDQRTIDSLIIIDFKEFINILWQELKIDLQNDQFYLSQDIKKLIESLKDNILSCQKLCPCCGRLCDKDHWENQQIQIGDVGNQHDCQQGHQFGIFNDPPVAIELGDNDKIPSLAVCSDWSDDFPVYYNETKEEILWRDFTQRHNNWNFKFLDSGVNYSEQKQKFGYIFDKIQVNYCKKENKIRYIPFKNFQLSTCMQKKIKALQFYFFIDESGSMGDKMGKNQNRFQILQKSLKSFVEERRMYLAGNLKKNIKTEDTITIVGFTNEIIKGQSGTRQVRCYQQNLLEKLPFIEQCIEIDFVGGRTEYSIPLQWLIEEIESHNKNITDNSIVLVFQSDGVAIYPNKQINQLNIQKNRKKFASIYFQLLNSNEKEGEILQKMSTELGGIYTQSQNLDQMKEEYQKLAKMVHQAKKKK